MQKMRAISDYLTLASVAMAARNARLYHSILAILFGFVCIRLQFLRCRQTNIRIRGCARWLGARIGSHPSQALAIDRICPPTTIHILAIDATSLIFPSLTKVDLRRG